VTPDNSSQYFVLVVDVKSPLEVRDCQQTFWVKVEVGREMPPNPGRYKNMQTAIAIALHDPNWKGATIPGVGNIHFNPGLVIHYDCCMTVKPIHVYSGSPVYPDEWIAWTKLPPIPPNLIGTKLTFQLLCWEKQGPPNYCLTGFMRKYGHYQLHIPFITVIPK